MQSLAFLVLALLVLLFSFPNCALAQDPQPAPRIEGTLEKIPCPFDASKALRPVECGRLKVPEDYDEPKGRSVEIAFMVVKTQRNIDPKRPVLFLNGGPGETSLYGAESLVVNPFIQDVVTDRDWVFFDQRGTGRSTPTLYCPDSLRKCRDDLIKQDIDLSQYNSARIAGDTEALRKALGVTQWNLWGNSYGSRLAFIIAQYYPSSVRSIIHDASSLPENRGEPLNDAQGTEAALNRIFSKCAADTACSSKFPELRSRFIAALPRLRQQPLSVGERRFDDSSVVRFFFNWFYPRGYTTREHRLQNILIFMDAAARGDGRLMLDTQQRMRKDEEVAAKGDPSVPIYGQFFLGQNLSIYCRERKPLESTYDLQLASAESEIMRSLLKGIIETPADRCTSWPAGQADPIEATHVYFDGPQLVFTGELDASGSGINGYKVEMLYANARNVVFRNGTHGQFHPEVPNQADADSQDHSYWKCALRLGHQFLADPDRKLDTSCAETRQLRLVQ